MKVKTLITIALSYSLFGFSSEPHSSYFSFNTDILLIQAEAEDIKAQYKLAHHYEVGIGVKQNKFFAKKWYRTAALAGHVEAQVRLGMIYKKDKNYVEAKEWFQHAANQMHPEGIINLASMYEKGLGVLRNHNKANKLYLQAAELGDVYAMYKLSQFYADSEREEDNKYQQCVWIYLANKYLSPNYPVEKYKQLKQHVKLDTHRCESILSEEQNSSAKHKANNWRPRIISFSY